MNKYLIFSVAMLAAVTTVGAIPNFSDDFQTLYTEGQTFVEITNGWQASGSDAYVTNSGGYLDSKAVVMGERVALTNTLSAAANLKVWTDFRIKPKIGLEVADPATNSSSFLCYFNSNGIVVVATAAGWHVCTNDIWGNTVEPATNNAYVRISVFQDYSTSNQAVFLNDQLIIQDLRFVGTPEAYNRLVIRNTTSSCWLDNVGVRSNVTGLASNRNNDVEGKPDADELQQYGYARRTLYVNGAGTPNYPTITAALSVWRPRDSIYVYAGTYDEVVTVTSNVAFEGQGFTVSALTVATNASVTFAQSVNCTGTFALTGQVVMASGASLTSTTAHVVGSLSISGNGAFVVTSLDVGSAGLVTFVNAQLVASAAGVSMNGTFAISNTWGSVSLASMPLPFSDNFDLYAGNTVVTSLKFRGWSASDDTVTIQTNQGVGNSQAVVLPDSTTLYNSITTTATKVWTDFFIRPALGLQPAALETNTSSFLAYANTNGYLVVAIAGGGWVVCSNKLDNTPATPLQTNGVTRVTICQDLSVSPPTFAVFVASNLVAQGLSAPANINRYSSFLAKNRSGTAAVDGVLITTEVPSWLTSDLDGNGLADAYEINTYGRTSQFLPRGTIYKFR
ncbi:MAG: hypothetical protein WCS52_13815 [bacterium]